MKNVTDYIGDGVYVVWDGVGIELRANSHDCPTDTIYLEPKVIDNLNIFIKRMKVCLEEV
jgi:hypothetical protein